MKSTTLLNFKVTEGEYGSLLEVLYHSIETQKYDLTEKDCFDEIDDFIMLNNIRKRFLVDDYLEKGLFAYPSEIPCLVKHIDKFLNMEVNKDTINELESIKNKFRNLVQKIVKSFIDSEETPKIADCC